MWEPLHSTKLYSCLQCCSRQKQNARFRQIVFFLFRLEYIKMTVTKQKKKKKIEKERESSFQDTKEQELKRSSNDPTWNATSEFTEQIFLKRVFSLHLKSSRFIAQFFFFFNFNRVVAAVGIRLMLKIVRFLFFAKIHFFFGFTKKWFAQNREHLLSLENG